MTKSQQSLLMELAAIDPDLITLLVEPTEPPSRPELRRVKLEVKTILKHKSTFKTIIRKRRIDNQSK